MWVSSKGKKAWAGLGWAGLARGGFGSVLYFIFVRLGRGMDGRLFCRTSGLVSTSNLTLVRVKAGNRRGWEDGREVRARAMIGAVSCAPSMGAGGWNDMNEAVQESFHAFRPNVE